jgi:hypothetical protein
MLVLTRENLMHILGDYPAVERAMRSEAERRRQMQMTKIMDMWRRANIVKEANRIIAEGKQDGRTAAASIAQYWSQSMKKGSEEEKQIVEAAAVAENPENADVNNMSEAQISEFKRATVMLDNMGKEFSEKMQRLQQRVEHLDEKAARTIDGKESGSGSDDEEGATSEIASRLLGSQVVKSDRKDAVEDWQERGESNMALSRSQLSTLINFIERDIPRLKSQLSQGTNARSTSSESTGTIGSLMQARNTSDPYEI